MSGHFHFQTILILLGGCFISIYFYKAKNKIFNIEDLIFDILFSAKSLSAFKSG